MGSIRMGKTQGGAHETRLVSASPSYEKKHGQFPIPDSQPVWARQPEESGCYCMPTIAVHYGRSRFFDSFSVSPGEFVNQSAELPVSNAD